MSNKEQTREWRKWLGPGDLLDISRTRSEGRLVQFSLNLCTKTASGWKEVIRYDTHHGRLHLHRFWRKAKDQVEFLEKEEGEIQDYEPHFEAAKSDIDSNWSRYRRLVAQKDEQGPFGCERS